MKGFTAGGEDTALRFDDPELTFILPLSCHVAAQKSLPPPEASPMLGGLAAVAGTMWPPMGELPKRLTPVEGVLDEAIAGGPTDRRSTSITKGRNELLLPAVYFIRDRPNID